MNEDNFEKVVKDITNKDYIECELVQIQKCRRNRNNEPFVISFCLHLGANIIRAFRIDGVDYYDIAGLLSHFHINTFENAEDYLGERVIFRYTNATKGHFYENGRAITVEEVENFKLISEFNLPYLLFYADEKYTMQMIVLYAELVSNLDIDISLQRAYFESYCTKSGISKARRERLIKELMQ